MTEKIVIIDNGSAYTKAGFADQESAQEVLPTVIGTPKSGSGDIVLGEEAIKNRRELTLKHPIKRGIINDWDSMQKLWNYGLEQLHADVAHQAVLMTEPAVNTSRSREKVTQLMFEAYNVPGFYLQSQSVLSLYASGRTSGTIVESGDGVTNIVPIYAGYDLKYATFRIDVSGCDLNEYLLQQINDQSPPPDFEIDLEDARDMKEKLCYVSLDAQAEAAGAASNASLEQKYNMPDGHVVTLRNERFLTPEVLFQPDLLGFEDPGIHDAIAQTIKKCPLDCRKELYEHVILSGGTTLFAGYVERLNKELRALFPANVKSDVTANPDRWDVAWLGGAVLASLSSFEECWITKKDFEEIGPAVVHLMCK